MSLFITFEGGEGSGKTTQIHLLKKALQKKGFRVMVTREPGGTLISDQIRHVLLSTKNKKMTPLTELLLYEASRSQHVEELIRPKLKKGHVVISDRYADASVVYQGVARKLKASLVKKLNAIATGGLQPKLTIVLDCQVKTGLGRVKKRSRKGGTVDRIEKEGARFHQSIRKGYLRLAKQEPKRVKIVDGARPPQEIHEDILKIILRRL